MYNEKVMQIFQNPEHVGEIKDANAVGKVGNVSCGDIMKLYLKINDEEIIEDASFKTFGCAAAIVSSSIACGLIIGKKVDEALKLENEEILKIAGGLPTHKIHCSILAKEAIEDAITNYRKAKKKELIKRTKEKMEKLQPKKKTTKKEG